MSVKKKTSMPINICIYIYDKTIKINCESYAYMYIKVYMLKEMGRIMSKSTIFNGAFNVTFRFLGVNSLKYETR